MRLPEGREWAVAVMLVLMFFSIGGAYGCIANLPRPVEADVIHDQEDIITFKNGSVFAFIDPDNGNRCYVLYNRQIPVSISCTPQISLEINQ